MREHNWKRKEYESWDEAFRGLTPVVRQQSVRVAAYTQVLYVQAVKMKFGCNTSAGQERMRGQYADFIYKCGMYHQLGKALVPPDYQILQTDFTEEELAVYKKYTTDGRLLVATLQQRGSRASERRKNDSVERPTKSILWMILRECCEQHMERWDGSGYPNGLLGSDISAPAQIVGIAKELDHLASETRSETPFDLAIETLISASGKDWSPELIEVLKASRENCFSVYNKYINYTRTLPRTVPLVERCEGRSMGLSYRPMATEDSNIVPIYEAIPWFGDVANEPGETQTIEDLRELFKRTNLVEDLSWYFLYEAADTVLRMRNCNLTVEALLLQMIPEFYHLGTQLQRFNRLFADQPIPKESLLLTIPMEILEKAGKTALEIIERYIRNGICLVVDDLRPNAEWTAERLSSMGITRARLSEDLYQTPEGTVLLQNLRMNGITVYGKQADTPEVLAWLNNVGAFCSSGTMVGVSVREDEMILDCLAREEL